MLNRALLHNWANTSSSKLGACILWLLVSTFAVAEYSPDEFTERFVAAIEESAQTGSVEIVDTLQLKVIDADDNETSFFLGNAYEIYLQDEESLDDVIAIYVASLEETITHESSTLLVENVVPIVKDDAWAAEVAASLRASGAESEIQYFVEPLAEGLDVFYAEDTPSNIRYLDKQLLLDAGVEIETIRQQAVDNLLAILPDIEVHGSDGLFMITADGNYEASLLLVNEIWTPLNFDIRGDIVISIPARDMLLVSGSENTEELAQMIEIIDEIYSESPYHLTRELYVRRDDKWHIFRN